MRNAALILGFVACGHAANSQLSLLPQVGFESSKTILRYNDASTLYPRGVQVSPQVSLRLSYFSKQGHGVFAGVASSRSIVNFMVDDAENALSTYRTAVGSMQFRFEGGYQFSSPKIMVSKPKQAATQKTVYRTVYSRCGYSKKVPTQQSVNSKPSSWLRFQPLIGMGVIPAVKDDVVFREQGYTYRAGNWNTALLAGANFEFGKGNKQLFTVSVNYINAMGGLEKEMISTEQGGKTTTTMLQSDISGWNMRVGIPLSLGKSKSVKAKTTVAEKTHRPAYNRCYQYKSIYRCGR
jgi:hypothetical protein